MNLTNSFPCSCLVGIVAAGLGLIQCLPSARAESPTVRVAIERSTNRFVNISWAPPTAALQSYLNAAGGFADVPGATTAYAVDTRLAPYGLFRARLRETIPTVYVWRDSMLQPGRIAVEWLPRDWRLQETSNLSQWQYVASTPVRDWYYPPAALEAPSAPGGVLSGTRAYRIVAPGPAAPSQGGVYSVNYLGYANLAFQIGQSNFFSFPLAHFDRSLNTLLPLPPEADGTLLQFYDTATQQYGAPLEFVEGVGWVDFNFHPALRPAVESACVIFPRSSIPGATVVSTMFGELPQGSFQRTLAPGYSLNGPLIPFRGGITTVHNLQAEDGDLVFLFNTVTRSFDAYESFSGMWFNIEETTVEEPVVGWGEAFFFLNNNGPLIWTQSFSIPP